MKKIIHHAKGLFKKHGHQIGKYAKKTASHVAKHHNIPTYGLL